MVTFVGGSIGSWRVDRIEAVRGQRLPPVDRLEVAASSASRSTSKTWFEYAPEHTTAFEELLARLRASDWTYVERDVDIRLTR